MSFFSYIENIEIAPTELCNLKCGFCPRSNGYPNQNFHISEEVVKEIRTQLDEYNYRNVVSIAGKGEPTLTKDFDKILDILTKDNPRYKLLLVTNGKKLIDFEKYLDEIDTTLYNVYSPDLELCKKLKELYSKYKNVDVSCSETHNKHNKNYSDITYQEVNEKSGTSFSNRVGYLSYNEEELIAVKHVTCDLIFKNLFINWNGDYYLCCDDWTNNTISNIFEESIFDYVEKNETLNRYREYHLMEKRQELDICKTCTRNRKLRNKKKFIDIFYKKE